MKRYGLYSWKDMVYTGCLQMKMFIQINKKKSASVASIAKNSQWISAFVLIQWLMLTNVSVDQTSKQLRYWLCLQQTGLTNLNLKWWMGGERYLKAVYCSLVVSVSVIEGATIQPQDCHWGVWLSVWASWLITGRSRNVLHNHSSVRKCLTMIWIWVESVSNLM